MRSTAADAWPRLHALLDGLDVTDVRRCSSSGRSRRGEIVYAATGTDALRRLSRGRLPHARSASTATTSPSRCAARRPPRTCRPRASPASTRAILNVRGAGDAVRGVPALLRLAVHRPRHRLSHRQRLRPLQGRAVGRRDEDGALRPGVERRHLHARHRVRLPRRRVHHRRLRPGRERRAGQGRSRRVLRPQADLPRRAIARCCAARSAASSSRLRLRRGPCRRHDTRQRRRPRPSARALLPRRCRGADLADYAIRIEDHYSALAGHPVPMDIEWAKDGDGRRALHRPGAAGDGGLAAHRRGVRELRADRRAARCWSPAGRSARRSPPARCA